MVFGSVPGVGSRAGDGRVGGPGGRAGSGLRPPGTRGWAWVPAGSGLDLVPCSGLSVSLALLGKVWVLGLGRGAACGGRRCPGREALRQASGSAEVAEGQATKGSSGGGGGRTNFLIGYRAGRSHRGEQGAPQSPAHAPPPQAPPPQAPPPASTHSTRRTPGRRRGQAGGGAFATKETDKRENKTENVPLAEQPEPPEQQAGWGSTRPPPALGAPCWAGSLTRGLLSGLVDRPEEAPLMDLDLGTQARRRLRRGAPSASPLRRPRPSAGLAVPRAGLPCPPPRTRPRRARAPGGHQSPRVQPAAWGLLFPPRKSCPTSEAQSPRPRGQRGALSTALEPDEQRDVGGEAPRAPSPHTH